MADATQHPAREPPLATAASDLKQAGLDQVEKVSAQAERVVGAVADQAKQTVETVQDVASTVDATVRQALKDQPMAMLAGVAVLGFVLGALWKSK